MWSEEELREVEPEPPKRRTGARAFAGSLRQVLSARNLSRVEGDPKLYPHETTRGASPSVIYTPAPGQHGNFIDASYRRILRNEKWSARLQKAHTAKRQARRSGIEEEVRPWRELDSANSSDALLMSIFCYPRILATAPLPALLGVDRGLTPEFGFHPRISLERDLEDRTEIDMRLGSLFIEAKLTESHFQTAPLRLLERYPGFASIFRREALDITRAGVSSYQLIRGVLAAHAEDATFCVLLDVRRPDLREAWIRVISAVQDYELRSRLRVLTWQELSSVLPPALRRFLASKYGIEPA